MNNILDLIPQPICSDGKKEIVQNAKNQGWETNDELIPTFFKPIEPQLIDLFTQYPDQMKMDPPLNIPFQFSPTASLMKLPENYALLVRERTVIIVGHPRSCTEMLPHYAWLIGPKRQPCQCHLCIQMALKQPMNPPVRPMYPPQQYPHQILPQIPPQIPSQMSPQTTQVPVKMEYPRPENVRPFNNSEFPNPFQTQPLLRNQFPPPIQAASPLSSQPHTSPLDQSPQVSGQATSKPQYITVKQKVPETPDDPKARKLEAQKSENDETEKQIIKLKESIVQAKKKIDRLKFERRLLLGALTAQDQTVSKRAIDLSSDEEDQMEPEIESEKAISGPEDEEDAYNEKKKRKRAKSVIDPNAPKRPANAFIMFSELSRESTKEERRLLSKLEPDTEHSLSNLTKALGSRWKQLPAPDREIYQAAFKEVVKQHDIDHKYYLSIPVNERVDRPVPLEWLDPQCPKRPINPFVTFCEAEDERIKALGEQSHEEEVAELALISKGYAQRWREMTKEEQTGYTEKYNESLQAYKNYVQTSEEIDELE